MYFLPCEVRHDHVTSTGQSNVSRRTAIPGGAWLQSQCLHTVSIQVPPLPQGGLSALVEPMLSVAALTLSLEG
jgi:hypothetical protein